MYSHPRGHNSGVVCFQIAYTVYNRIALNKQLHNFNYVCLTAGAAGLVFSAFYPLVFLSTRGNTKMTCI